jgi:aquaporin-4
MPLGGFKGSVDRNLDDLKNLKVWKASLAEVFGTTILVFIGCAVCLENWQLGTTGDATVVQISLSFGLAVATAVWCIGHISGGHINPAVTVAMLVTRKITLARAFLYVLAQCAGAVFGAFLVYMFHPVRERDWNLGNTEIQEPVTRAAAFFLELVITFILVFTVFASCDRNRTDLGGSAALAIGFSVTCCHLFAIKYTGASMNPARTLGPSIVINKWNDHWIYWIGPLTGGCLAGWLYEFVFAADATTTKFLALMIPGSTATYDPHPEELSAQRDKRIEMANKHSYL